MPRKTLSLGKNIPAVRFVCYTGTVIRWISAIEFILCVGSVRAFVPGAAAAVPLINVLLPSPSVAAACPVDGETRTHVRQKSPRTYAID